MSDDPKYDPVMCITAGELRALGAQLTPDIPDCAWVRRSALKFGEPKAVVCDDGTMNGVLILTISDRFQWLEIDAVIGKDGEVISSLKTH